MIIHIDFDSFYAACERNRHPEYSARPIAIASTDEIDPLILAATYSAKAKGVFTTQRASAACKACSDLVILPADIAYYQDVSASAAYFFSKHIPTLEQFSIDEFFGDLSGYIKGQSQLEQFAASLQQQILRELGLDASMGISTSKWSAKLLTTLAKPFGILISSDINPYLQGTSISKFPGIGKVLARKLKAHGILTLDMALAHPELFSSLSEQRTYKRIAGIDAEPIIPNAALKSTGASHSFRAHRDLSRLLDLAAELADELAANLLKKRLNPQILTLSYRGRARSRSWRVHLDLPLRFAQIRALARELAFRAFEEAAPIYHLGLNASKFIKPSANLFNAEAFARQERLNALLSEHPELVQLPRRKYEKSRNNL